MTAIGFIGLGNMGSGMCANLARKGFAVRAFDLNADALLQAAQQGAQTAASAADAVTGADVIVTMLPAGRHVLDVLSGSGGVLAAARPGALVIDCSTIAVDEARAMASTVADAGLALIDAPVSGGVTAAEAGTLTFMVGGTADGFARARPILEAMGKNVFHAGANGNGQAAKIANNMLLGISMIGTCEAFNLAEKLGLDAQTFFDIASTASGQCWSMTGYCPAPGPVPAAPSNRDYKAGFAVAMMLKDLRLAAASAGVAGAETPLGTLATEVYSRLEADGYGGMDFSGVMRRIKGDI
jgi:3-hydroxyisobutyrate dehydrogenase